jgi:pyruvate formate lyase activating enzyme
MGKENYNSFFISRREFLKNSIAKGVGFGLYLGSLGAFLIGAGKKGAGKLKKSEKKEKSDQTGDIDSQTGATSPLREAMYYKRHSHENVQCGVCFRSCIIPVGERGECRNRINKKGTLYNIVYSRPSAIQVDPIEKEPQYHMLPGTLILCFGTAGCNFKCKFCQNWHLSQRSLDEIEYYYLLSPAGAVKEARKRQIPTISFTYNEPTSFYEYVFDIAKIAKEEGLFILWHSNGAMSPDPLLDLLKFTDAVTIDLKGLTNEFYRKYSSAELKPVLRTLEIIKKRGKWIEIVNLMIPTLNDHPEDIYKMCVWIKENLGPEVPVHFNRFFPSYKLTNLPPTPVETLERAHGIAKEVGLDYVLVGNVPGHRYNSTYCPKCGNILIRRTHFQVQEYTIDRGRCSKCQHPIPGIWKMV